jgi:hypothetical protein
MPNTTTKHPALAQQVERAHKAIEDKAAETAADISGWHTFTPKQKRVLSVLPLCETVAEACRRVDMNAKAFQFAMRKNEDLRSAVHNRTIMTMSIMQRIVEDSAAESMDNLIKFARGGMDEMNVPIAHGIQMDAIKTVLKINKIGEDKPEVKEHTISINTQVIVPGGRSEDSRETIVVDATTD